MTSLAVVLCPPPTDHAARPHRQPEAPTHHQGPEPAVGLRCEYQVNPLGLDDPCPRLSWQIVDGRRGAVQAAYRILVASSEAVLDAGGGDLWDTGKIESAQSTHVPYAGAPAQSAQRCFWKVRTWDRHDCAGAWSAPAWWEVGLPHRAQWTGRWIGASSVGSPRAAVPCPYLRKSFTLPKPIASARLYITALGLYECHINGRRIGLDVFTPGWTDYAKRVQYQTYDVTALLCVGPNAIGAILGDGWCCGHLCWAGRQVYFDRPRLLAQMQVTFTDGTTQTVVTDPSWKTEAGPIVESDLLMGESYDARLELPGWSKAGFDDSAWSGAKEFEDPGLAIQASASPPVRATMELSPIAQADPGRAWPGRHIIYDLGQNIVGRVRLKIRGTRGLTVRLRYAEMLNADGTLYTANLRSARATDYYTLKGEGEETFETRFTFHGFRYVELEGNPLPPLEGDALTAIVLHSDLPVTGEFTCSDELVSRLQCNIQWGQRGNFVEVPTDCPQRDERLGWTGDAQAFVRTACFNMNVGGFFTKWMQDLRDAQNPAGAYPMVAPNHGYAGDDGGPAWAEAGVICPWTIYQCFGDLRILQQHYESMARFVEQLRATSRDLIRPYDGYEGFAGFGDWLAIDAPNPGAATTPKSLIGTAYFARSVQLMARIAGLLGKPDDALRYSELWQQIRRSFCDEFVTPRGMVAACTQTGYLLALAFDLIEPQHRPAVIERLVAAVRDRDWHLSTGFVGTPLLAPVLTRCGRPDVAYRVLMQETYPGWLYSVRQGATTMWERWNSWTKEQGFGDPGMNSFNHYAYGSIGQWLYATVAGIDLDEDKPGYRHLIVRPEIGGRLTWAKASLQSMYGLISTHWHIENGRFTLDLTVPPNTHATVYLPATRVEDVRESGQPLASAAGLTQALTEAGKVVCDIGSGTYHFELAAPPA